MSVGKRLFDVSFSALGVLLLLPFFLLIALSLLVGDGAPVFFRQERVGYHGRSFRMWKFRTMVRGAERIGQPLTVGQDLRVTPVGRWLRKHKLDELPQLINVLKGEMSFVGPRPEVARYVALYSPEQRRVLDLVPGITDPASIAFRDEEDLLGAHDDPERAYVEHIMPEKIRLNLAYAVKAGVFRDMGVILRTVGVVGGGSMGNVR